MTPVHEVAARWCYAELKSPRFGNSYKNLVPLELFAKANNNISFDELTVDEVAILQEALALHHDRGPVFYKMLTNYSHYKRESRNYYELSAVVVVPYFGSCTFTEFEKDPHPSVQKKLDGIPLGSFRQDEPVIIIPFNGREMLLEGTLRSLWFARDRNLLTKLEAWVPTAPTE